MNSAKKSLGLLLSLSLLGASPCALADPAPAPTSAMPAREEPRFTLAEAVALLEKSHPLLAAAEQSARATAKDAVAAGLWANPTLSTSYTYAWNSSYDRIGLLTAGVTQFLDVAGTPAARRRALERASLALAQDREALRRELVLDLERAAVDAAFSGEILAVQEDYQRRVREVARIVEARVDSGAAPHYDVDRIALVDSNAEADATSAAAARERTGAALLAAIGPQASQLRGRLDFDLGQTPNLPSLRALLDFLRTERPDVVAARTRVAASEASVEAAKRSVFPGFAISVGTAFGQAPGQIDLGGAIAVPLPVVDHGQGSVQAARLRVEQSRAEVDALLSPAELLIAGIYAEVERRRSAEATYLARMSSARETMLGEALAGYQGGKLSVLELADAYSSWRDSKLRALALSAEARAAEIELGRVTGTSLRQWDERRTRGGAS